MLSHDELRWVLDTLADTLTDAQIQRVYERDPSCWVLQCRAQRHTWLLTVCVDPDQGRIHLSPRKPKQPPTPSGFTMLLRKWCQGMVVRQVQLDPQDRVLTLRGDVADPAWTPPDPDATLSDASDADADPASPGSAQTRAEASPQRAPRVPVALVIEWTGRVTNAMVLGAQDRVLGLWHRDASPGRVLRVGARYQPPQPPPQDGKLRHRWADAPSSADPSALIAQTYETDLSEQSLEQARAALRQRLTQQRRRTARLLSRVEQDLARASRARSFREYGELLQGAFQGYRKGMQTIEVTNYYDEAMPQVSIPLDPALDLQANIAHYFKQYRRLHDATARIEERLLQIMEHSEALDAALARLPELDDLEALGALRAELEARGALTRRAPQAPPERHQARKALPYRTFESSRGSTILVGKGGAHNDTLTVQVARGRDLWCHARDWAGAHVVLRLERDQQPHPSDVHEAAMLAAHFSKGREDTLIDVTVTQARHVRKPRGYPPGRVTVASGAATRAVSLQDEEALRALLARERREDEAR